MGSWDYAEARGSAHGTMCCIACGKQVETGRYRYRQKSKNGDWGYQVQHEACSPDDRHWAAVDVRQAEHAKFMAELSIACAEFKEKWGVDDLNEYICTEDEHDT